LTRLLGVQAANEMSIYRNITISVVLYGIRTHILFCDMIVICVTVTL